MSFRPRIITSIPEAAHRLYRAVERSDALWRAVVELPALVFVIVGEVTHSLPTNVTLGLLALVVASAVVISSAHLVRFFARIRLNDRRQALCWSHYRQLLTELSFRSVFRNRQLFDFVTFVNGDFEDALLRTFYSELQYVRAATPNLDMVIFDIEYTRDLRSQVSVVPQSDGTLSLVPLQSFMRSAAALNPPEPLARALRDRDLTYAIPLRWGVSGVAISSNSHLLNEAARATGIDLTSIEHFDLRWLLYDHPLRSYVADPHNRVHLVALDWYLPSLVIIAAEIQAAAPYQLTPSNFESLRACLFSLKSLFHPKYPLFKDPLRLAKYVHAASDEVLIVLGGGNWLRLSGISPAPSLRCLPVARLGYVIWSECLGFLAPNGAPPNAAWGRDMAFLADWFIKRRGFLDEVACFTAYDPSVLERLATPRNTVAEADEVLGRFAIDATVLRDLPPSTHDYFVSRQRWQELWHDWRVELPGVPQ
jgi:hypothetical protein